MSSSRVGGFDPADTAVEVGLEVGVICAVGGVRAVLAGVVEDGSELVGVGAGDRDPMVSDQAGDELALVAVADATLGVG